MDWPGRIIPAFFYRIYRSYLRRPQISFLLKATKRKTQRIKRQDDRHRKFRNNSAGDLSNSRQIQEDHHFVRMPRMSKKKLIDAIEVKNPCSESWEDMRGTASIRFCSHCAHSVNNLSGMTRKEAMRLVRRSEGRRRRNKLPRKEK